MSVEPQRGPSLPSIESAVIRVVVDVSETLSDRLAAAIEPEFTSFSVPGTAELLDDLGTDAEKLQSYLNSPDFAAVAAQYRVRPTLNEGAEDQVRQGLRLAGLPEELLGRASGVVRRVLILACQEVMPLFHRPDGRVDHHDVATAAAVNSRVLMGLTSLTGFHAFAARLRGQVVALHNSIRLPHIGVSRAVHYDQLYVRPGIESSARIRLGAPGDRTVILGDPGAGKSTFAAKFAHDVASDGRVPFLLVLREFTDTFGQGGHDLLHYLEMVCQAPYNVKPPADAVDYLLRTGRAVVVLDGLDEIVQTELRRRVVALVEGFAHLYPLVPILVTARRIGYEEAPLDDQRFATAHILPFSEEQVRTYVRRWFVLDAATSPTERERLIDSFIEDSEQINELRSNPLLLALLCAMYSSDRYLPRNLAQVYERCALMLFEQWDTRRGVPLPLKFHGRLRGAVQHLAWKMFTAPESGKAESRTRIVATLTQYLEGKLEDHDESVATAEQFLAFCTGRAWILTDVGATNTEPQFGFTHRTFLEYFAAEHLVRTHRTAAELWAVLDPSINQWEVVAQIVLQLYDRNVEGGVDELLTEALTNDGLEFAARSLHYMHPSTRTVRAISELALGVSARLPVAARLGMGLRFTVTDEALADCMYRCSPANRATVEQTVISCLEPMIENGEAGAVVVLEMMATQRADDRWAEIAEEVRRPHAAVIAELAADSPWGAVFHYHDAEALSRIVQRHGVRSLYLNWGYDQVTRLSPGLGHLQATKTRTIEGPTDLIAIAMAEQPAPWADADEFNEANALLEETNDFADAFGLMVSLPFLELYTSGESNYQLSSTHTKLLVGRHVPVEQETTLRWIEGERLPDAVCEFLKRWVRREVSVTRPVRQQPHPSPVPR